jgi:hypothetical protein
VSAAGESREGTRASPYDASFTDVCMAHPGTYPLVEPDGVRPRAAEIALNVPATEGPRRYSLQDNDAGQRPYSNCCIYWRASQQKRDSREEEHRGRVSRRSHFGSRRVPGARSIMAVVVVSSPRSRNSAFLGAAVFVVSVRGDFFGPASLPRARGNHAPHQAASVRVGLALEHEEGCARACQVLRPRPGGEHHRRRADRPEAVGRRGEVRPLGTANEPNPYFFASPSNEADSRPQPSFAA